MGLLSKALSRFAREPKLPCGVCGRALKQGDQRMLLRNGEAKVVCDRCYAEPEPICFQCGKMLRMEDRASWFVTVSKGGMNTICSDCRQSAQIRIVSTK